MASTAFPPNVHVSQHPCLRAKLSRLRSQFTAARETKSLIHEISLIIACEALAKGTGVVKSGKELSSIGYEYEKETMTPEQISLVPILRSGLAMVDALQTLLPEPVPVHHLGLFREPTTLQPVEYYNNLPYHQPPAGSTSDTSATDLAILLDPIVATGGTSVAAIQTLKEWGVKKVILIAVLGSAEGVRRAAEEWEEGVEVWLGDIDGECDAKGMIKPGLGDVGDRLFLTKGK
ncbi:MAG: hypothetical protein M4579_004430 [Chaenotheca gracillima]|nr:MAG: hypothetical protein M4579_004430 [Chaenotheca gracillima]